MLEDSFWTRWGARGCGPGSGTGGGGCTACHMVTRMLGTESLRAWTIALLCLECATSSLWSNHPEDEQKALTGDMQTGPPPTDLSVEPAALWSLRRCVRLHLPQRKPSPQRPRPLLTGPSTWMSSLSGAAGAPGACGRPHCSRQECGSTWHSHRVAFFTTVHLGLWCRSPITALEAGVRTGCLMFLSFPQRPPPR